LCDLFIGGAYLFEDPEVGGRSAISLQMSDNVDQYSLWTLLRVLLVELMLSKLNGPNNRIAGCVKSSSSAY